MTEHRVLLRVVALITGVGVASPVIGLPDRVTACVLIGAGLCWVAVMALRRERRIRVRLADPRTRPAAPATRAGPGDRTPGSPAPNPAPGVARPSASTGGSR